MIISRIHGGVGNQLFQYATGYALAKRLQMPFGIDTRAIQNYQVNPYLLDQLGMPRNEASRDERRRVLGIFSSCTKEKLLKGLSLFNSKIITDTQLDKYQRVLSRKMPYAYLVGYWQNSQYFEGLRDKLQQWISVRTLSTNLSPYHAIACKPGCIALHVRRGDYITNKKVHHMFGVCGLAYYQAAISYLCRHFSDLHVLVFSNDPEWAQKYMRFSIPVTYVKDEGAQQGHEVLTLMKQCQYHVIANSSFSWWGAWLSGAAGEKVCVPEPWYRSPKLSTHIVPVDWTKVAACYP